MKVRLLKDLMVSTPNHLPAGSVMEAEPLPSGSFRVVLGQNLWAELSNQDAVVVREGVDEVRGWLEKGQTWQARALAAEKRLADAYARLRLLDEQEAMRKLEAKT